MSPANSIKVQFYEAGPLKDDLEARIGGGFHSSSVSTVAKRDVERYYFLLKQALPAFSYGEAALMVDAMNGTIFEPHTVRLLWAEVADAIQLDHLDTKWQQEDSTLDGAALIEKLRGLSLVECMAVADAIERFWSNPNPMRDRLREVGLIRES